MTKTYTNYISLGYFCEVAQDLEKMGLRNFSSPFDWGISYFPFVIDAMDRDFEGFMDYDNLSQNISRRNHYHEDRYHFYFFHDFNQYKSLKAQYPVVKEKYERRISRFLNAIHSPTLFIRYISTEELDTIGRSVELNWIEQNYSRVLNVLQRYNSDNKIIFIGDETVNSEVIKVYHVPRDEGDRVSRLPIFNNKELFPLLSSVEFPNKEENKRRCEIKAKKKRSVFTKFSNKAKSFLRRKFLKEYTHNKTYNIPDK